MDNKDVLELEDRVFVEKEGVGTIVSMSWDSIDVRFVVDDSIASCGWEQIRCAICGSSPHRPDCTPEKRKSVLEEVEEGAWS